MTILFDGCNTMCRAVNILEHYENSISGLCLHPAHRLWLSKSGGCAPKPGNKGDERVQGEPIGHIQPYRASRILRVRGHAVRLRCHRRQQVAQNLRYWLAVWPELGGFTNVIVATNKDAICLH